MTLILEIEFLTGVFRASRGPGRQSPDWPPQPDRVFSALVSAWGARGETPEERAALEWLEVQPPPAISSSKHDIRTALDVFVPPNDLEASSSAAKYLKILPDRRPRQARRFPATRPHDPVVKMTWPSAPNSEVLDALNSLASCVGYVGHSASLTRCRFSVDRSQNSCRAAKPASRRLYPGRLSELEEAHRINPVRPVYKPGMSMFAKHPPEPDHRRSEWLILEITEGNAPDIRATALVCRLLRQALMAGYRKSGWGNEVPETVSGHASDGTPTKYPHLSIAPMAFVGSPYADGRLFGFAIIPPRGQSLLGIEKFHAAFESIAPYCSDTQRRTLSLHGPPLKTLLRLSPAPIETKQSLLSGPYLKESHCWASVTPVVLDRHLKQNNEMEVRELIARSCENAGLPSPKPERIWVGKHSAVTGAPAARPLTGEPPWMRWKLPKSLQSRQLVHTVIDFEQAISGPVLLGAGRFTGLGLCRTKGN